MREIWRRLGNVWAKVEGFSFESMRDTIFGFDLFVSYDFDEGSSYAIALVGRLEALPAPIRCFLDRRQFNIGDRLNSTSRRRLLMSRHLAVILTPGVGKPESWVPRELEIFTADSQRNLDRIAPLNVDESLQKFPSDSKIRRFVTYLAGPSEQEQLLFHPVSAQEFAQGPSDLTIERIARLVESRRVDRQRLHFFQGAATVLLALALVAAALAFGFFVQREQARVARDDAIAALRTQSRLIRDVSQSQLTAGDVTGAALLALEGLPDTASPDPIRRAWPYLAEIETYLFANSAAVGEDYIVRPHNAATEPFLLSQTSDRLIIGGDLYDAQTGRLVAMIVTLESAGLLANIAFAKGGTWVVAVMDGTLKIFSSVDGKQLAGIIPSVSDVESFFFDANGNSAVTVHRDGSVRLQRVGQAGIELQKAEDGTDYSRQKRVAFDPTGRVFVLTTGGTSAELWSVAEGKLLRTIEEPLGIDEVVFDETGGRFVTLHYQGSSDDTPTPVNLYESRNGLQLQIFVGHSNGVWSAAFSPSDNRLITGSADNTAILWDTKTGVRLSTLSGHQTDVVNVAFVGKDKDRILTEGQGSNGNEQDKTFLRLWNIDGTAIGALGTPGQWISASDISPDRTEIALSEPDNRIQVWSLVDGSRINLLAGHTSYVRGIAYSNDGSSMISVSDDRTLRAWKLSSAPMWTAMVREPNAPIASNDLPYRPADVVDAALSSDGNYLSTLAAGEFPTRKLLSVHERKQGDALPASMPQGGYEISKPVIELPPEEPWAVDLARGLLARAKGSKVVLSRIYDNSEVDSATVDKQILHTRIGADGKTWTLETSDGTVTVRSIAEKRDLGRIAVGKVVENTAVDASSKKLLTITDDGDAGWWNLADGRRAGEASLPKDGAHRIIVDSLADRFAVISGERQVSIWTSDGRKIAEFLTNEPVNEMRGGWAGEVVGAFSPRGDLLALGAGSKIELWRIDTGIRDGDLVGHADKDVFVRDIGAIDYTRNVRVTDVVFLPDGNRIVSASGDGSIRNWSVDSKETVGIFTGHGTIIRAIPPPLITSTDIAEAYFFRGVNSVRVAGKGSEIVTASDDGTARVWPVFSSTQALVDKTKASALRCLTPDQRVSYRLERDPPEWCIEDRKWPFYSADWQAWLAARRSGHAIETPTTRDQEDNGQ